MYKSKLQEVCQKRAWGLPEYSSEKHGLDHCPWFSARVIVNNTTFDTVSPCTSSRDAQNAAAKLAFDHFSSDTMPSTPTSSYFPQPSLLPSFPLQPSSPLQSPTAMATANHSDGKQHMYKSRLQVYAQKKNIVFPIYSSERDGPPHASRFRCHVTVGGQTFHCPYFFPTLKEAENAAAKLALSSLSSDGEDDSVIYKNLLQEIAQKQGVPLPMYVTQRSGQVHSSVFFSTVEVNGESFSGEEARTKKLAEISAAKVAYNALKDRNTKPVQQLGEPTQLLTSSVLPSISTELPAPKIVNPSPTMTQNVTDENGDGNSSSSDSLNGSTLEVSPSKLMNGFDSNGSTDSVVESTSRSRPSPKLSLANKNITVYPASMKIPNGTALLPICDDNWNAFSGSS